MYVRIDLGNNVYTLIDEDDSYLNNIKWYYNDYAVHTNNETKEQYKLHRKILKIENPNMQIDHINQNKLDNRKCNLRIISSEQNRFNQKRKIKTSKFKGVSLHKNGNWIAQISYKKDKIYLGVFDNEIDAHLAYKNASLKYHKEHGYYTNKYQDIVNFNDYIILPRAKTTMKINTYKVLRDDGIIYQTIKDAAIDLNVKENTIIKACTDKMNNRKVRGYKLVYSQPGFYYVTINKS